MNSLPRCGSSRSSHLRNFGAFTIVEILVVVSIIVVLMALLTPAFTGIKGGTDLTRAAYDIQGVLDNARAYAMANNTFVYVGIVEVDSTLDPSISPQKTTADPTVGGRVAIAAVASKNGTRGYENTGGTLSNPAWDNDGKGYNNGASLVAIGKLQVFENVHLAPTRNTLPTTGNMARPTFSQADYMIGNKASASVTPFDWPLGKALGAGQYSFTKVINFDPQGAARVQLGTNQDFMPWYMEIGLIPSRGNIVASNLSNVAAIQIEGITGATHLYRP